MCVSAKIWLVKISAKIVKYESRVVKSNPQGAAKMCSFPRISINLNLMRCFFPQRNLTRWKRFQEHIYFHYSLH